MAKVFYQGHASLRFTTDNETVVFVDPFAGEGYMTPADMVLVTHEHYDHNAVEKITMKPETIVIRAKDALQEGVYYSFDYFGIHVQAVPCGGNKNHSVKECVGYVLEMDGVKVYVAGDTAKLDSMKELQKLNIDYAFLPIDGIFSMTPKEATECAKIIEPKHMIPYHMKPGMLWDYHQCMKVTYERAMLLKPYQEISL